MLTRFEHFAVTSMMGAEDHPPYTNGSLCFGEEWERTAFGVAMALARAGHFEWEDFRQRLIAEIADWEASHALDDPSWSYYNCWYRALESLVVDTGLTTDAELDAMAPNEERPELLGQTNRQ